MGGLGVDGMESSKLEPKLWTVIKEGYSAKAFGKDLVAGLIVGIVALPLSIALAIASGVRPEQGLYTAVVAGLLIALLSGSRVQIGGPTGAFIVLVYGIVHDYGYDGLAVATLLAGGLLVAMGFAKLGGVIKFIPYPVTVGFTGGIAVIIFVSQVRDFFGLRMESVPAHFYDKIMAFLAHASTVNVQAVVLGAASLAVMALWPRLTKRIPGSLVAIVLATTAAQLLHLDVETIGSRFGHVPDHLPAPSLPKINWADVPELFSPALAIALLAGIESLLSAVVADGMTGRRHRSNMELIAQGVANLASPFFGGIPATGAIARTATNIKNGGTTPVAGIVHAFTVLAIMLAFGRWAEMIPMAVLAAILMRVAIGMGEWHLFWSLLRAPRGDVLVLVSTFLLTVLVDLTVAIEAGVVLASFLFMHRMAEATEVAAITDTLNESEDEDDPAATAKREIPPGVEVFEIYGPFFFGAADRFKQALESSAKRPRVLILRMRHVNSMDATGLRALQDVYHKCRRQGTALILSGVHEVPFEVMNRADFLNQIGLENVAPDFDYALMRAKDILALPPAARQTRHG
jgi:SulP family sulfate permease